LFRFAQIADTHILESGSAAILIRALDRLKSMKAALSFLVLSGDMVENGQPEQYRMLLQALSGLTVPYHAVVGNHDLGNLSSRRRYSRFLGPVNRCFHVRGVACIILDTNNSEGSLQNWHGRVEPPAMRWLRRALAGLDARKPIVLFTHHGLFGSREELECDVENADEVLDLLRGRKLLGAFAGHAHRLRALRRGEAQFFICPALSTRRKNKGGEPPGMLLVDVDRDGVRTSFHILPQELPEPSSGPATRTT
jgi:predicted phosphodiesterase